MICSMCKGSGNLLTSQNARFEWWPCNPCGGAGVRVQYGPAATGQYSRRIWSGIAEEGLR